MSSPAQESAVAGRPPVAVLGAGPIGLATARELTRRGYDVHLYTERVAQVKGGGFWRPLEPPSGAGASTRKLYAQIGALQKLGEKYRPKYHLNCLEQLFFTLSSQLQNSPPQENRPFDALCDPISSPALLGMVEEIGRGPSRWPSQIVSKSSIFLGGGVLQLPLSIGSPRLESIRFDDGSFCNGWRGTVPQIDPPPVPTSWTERRFSSLEEILGLEEKIIFNCLGAGSRDLFGDEEIVEVPFHVFYFALPEGLNYEAELKISLHPPAWIALAPWNDRIVVEAIDCCIADRTLLLDYWDLNLLW